ncbi:hypothetical protein AJ87_23570 [Rhizobium yanglingense]|nr:hypothetical protein AJ87_23570 [Rhizobium yanglingense]
MPGEKDTQTAIGRAHGDHDGSHNHCMLMLDMEGAGKTMDADIVHRCDAQAEQQRREDHPRIRRLAK